MHISNTRGFISLVTIVGLMTAGCMTPTRERVYLRQMAADRPTVQKAPFSGQYRLYPNLPRFPVAGKATPMLEAHLRKGELFGFAVSETGQLLAVIRGERNPITDSAT